VIQAALSEVYVCSCMWEGAGLLLFLILQSLLSGAVLSLKSKPKPSSSSLLSLSLSSSSPPLFV
jgi:hypothetical protein